jgi:hypothetical protein
MADNPDGTNDLVGRARAGEPRALDKRQSARQGTTLNDFSSAPISTRRNNQQMTPWRPHHSHRPVGLPLSPGGGP